MYFQVLSLVQVPFVLWHSLPPNEELAFLGIYSLIKRRLNADIRNAPAQVRLSLWHAGDTLQEGQSESRSVCRFWHPEKTKVLSRIYSHEWVGVGILYENTNKRSFLRMKRIEIVLLPHIKAPQLRSTNPFFVNATCLLWRNQNQDKKKSRKICSESLSGMTLLGKWMSNGIWPNDS